MKKEDYLKNIQKSFDEGRISAEAYDAALMNAPAFVAEPEFDGMEELLSVLESSSQLEYKGIIFDEWTVDSETGGIYGEMCEHCAEKFKDILTEELSEGGIGACSVEGCSVVGMDADTNTHYYVDFKPELIHPVCTFNELIGELFAEKVDAFFENNGWKLIQGGFGGDNGFQIFFGKEVQVDNLYEYGFPCLYEKGLLKGFAKDFYENHITKKENILPLTKEMTDMLKTFVTGTGKEYKELLQLNENTGEVKIYAQNTDLGFPFSEYRTTIEKMGYKSTEHFRKEMSKGGNHQIDTAEQIQSEITGLLNLAKHRKEHGNYKSLILKDGSLSNDIIDRLKEYGFTTEEAIKKIEAAFKQHKPNLNSQIADAKRASEQTVNSGNPLKKDSKEFYRY